jgi:hypothetical protein
MILTSKDWTFRCDKIRNYTIEFTGELYPSDYEIKENLLKLFEDNIKNNPEIIKKNWNSPNNIKIPIEFRNSIFNSSFKTHYLDTKNDKIVKHYYSYSEQYKSDKFLDSDVLVKICTFDELGYEPRGNHSKYLSCQICNDISYEQSFKEEYQGENIDTNIFLGKKAEFTFTDSIAGL